MNKVFDPVVLDGILSSVGRARAKVEGGVYKSMVVCGDFNFPGVGWEAGWGYSGVGFERVFLDGVSGLGLSQMVDIPTTCWVDRHTGESKSNLIDLVLTGEPERILGLSSCPPLGALERATFGIEVGICCGFGW